MVAFRVMSKKMGTNVLKRSPILCTIFTSWFTSSTLQTEAGGSFRMLLAAFLLDYMALYVSRQSPSY
jgi:hypothetical protein